VTSSQTVFAIVGHPNEGKSSVLSTLTEDDRVVVSPFPGETVECQRFPVLINCQPLLEFVDTPGFQNPTKILAWMRESGLTDKPLLDAFFEHFGSISEYHHDCELMKPLRLGAGVVYVVDASRPLLEVDEAEMEILRLTNRPRMAIINNKEKDTDYLEDWKSSFRRHFNVVRSFNAHSAGFDDRIALLETLKAIHQDWEATLEKAIQAIQSDWELRKRRSAELILDFVEDALRMRIERSYSSHAYAEESMRSAYEAYLSKLKQKEIRLFEDLRKLYKHNLYDFRLSEQSILQEDLFSDKTWQLLGLTQKQLVATAAGLGAGVGAALDIAASGITFGIFTALGAVSAGSATYSGVKIWRELKFKGFLWAVPRR
jgi:ribosome biogenesis GTPase A